MARRYNAYSILWNRYSGPHRDELSDTRRFRHRAGSGVRSPTIGHETVGTVLAGDSFDLSLSRLSHKPSTVARIRASNNSADAVLMPDRCKL
jgi:hypothetical protein